MIYTANDCIVAIKYIFQFSDAIRAVLVHRFGGWYSDLDIVFLRSLKENFGGVRMYNIAASDDVDVNLYNQSSTTLNWGKSISNALFHNDAGHVFLKTVLAMFNSTFVTAKWASSGPMLFTKALDIICGQKEKQTRPLNPADYNRKKCLGMTIAKPSSFYPMNFYSAGDLSKKRPISYWEEHFQDSYAIHFYKTSHQQLFGTQPENNPTVLQPKHYGKELPALPYLGPRNCPLSFWSTRPF